MHAFTYALAAGHKIRHDLQTILKNNIPLRMVTELDFLFKFIVQSSKTTKKCLMIDINSTREEYKKKRIDYLWRA